MFTKSTSIGSLTKGAVGLRAVDRAISQQEIPYFIVGAMAKDIVLVHNFGSAIERDARDIALNQGGINVMRKVDCRF